MEGGAEGAGGRLDGNGCHIRDWPCVQRAGGVRLLIDSVLVSLCLCVCRSGAEIAVGVHGLGPASCPYPAFNRGHLLREHVASVPPVWPNVLGWFTVHSQGTCPPCGV